MLVIKSMMMLMTRITSDIIFFNELTMAHMAKIMLFKRNSLDDDGTSNSLFDFVCQNTIELDDD